MVFHLFLIVFFLLGVSVASVVDHTPVVGVIAVVAVVATSAASTQALPFTRELFSRGRCPLWRAGMRILGDGSGDRRSPSGTSEWNDARTGINRRRIGGCKSLRCMI